MIHYASETQPNQPLIRVAEERDEYNESAGVKRDQNMPYLKNQKINNTKEKN